MSREPTPSPRASARGRRAARAGSAAHAEPRLEIARIRVRRNGYDANGDYWGAGPDVYIGTIGAQEITVRARSRTEARAKIEAERARAPGRPQAERQPLGRRSPNRTRYELDWRDPVTGDAVLIAITHFRDYFGTGQDHVEIESIRPKEAPLSITETGYLSHFVAPLDLVNAGGPVTLVKAMLENASRSKEWRAKAAARAQGDLFQWATARGEVTARKTAPKPTRSVERNAAPRRRSPRRPPRDPQ